MEYFFSFWSKTTIFANLKIVGSKLKVITVIEAGGALEVAQDVIPLHVLVGEVGFPAAPEDFRVTAYLGEQEPLDMLRRPVPEGLDARVGQELAPPLHF